MAKRPLRFPRNTLRQGQFTVMVYRRSGEQLFTGVCLEFDLVDQHEDPDFLLRSMEEAAKGYVESVIRKTQSEDLLNRPAPSAYWEIYRKISRREESERLARDLRFARLAVVPYPNELTALGARSHVPARA
jgi:hypothetical protein